MSKICSNCGCECNDEYYKVLDNYLQVNYFDNDDLNCFCSKTCFCEYVILETIYIEEDPDNDNE